MNWKDEMLSIEQRSDWKSAAQLLERYNGENPELYLRVMFLILDFVVEGKYDQDEHDYAAKKLREIFDNVYEIFSNDSEFLFFIGIMIYIGEWYFGINDLEAATVMLKRAMDNEPNNTLYKWGYYSCIDQRLEQNTDLKLHLSEQILLREGAKVDWLKSKGLLGRYVLGTLEKTYEDLKAVKAPK